MTRWADPQGDAPDVLVVGAGVIGLTIAKRLAEAGRKVRVDAAALPLETTSVVAGAIWEPYHAAPYEKVSRWGAETLRTLTELAETDPSAGVRMLSGTMQSRAESEAPPWLGMVNGRRCHDAELRKGYVTGWAYTVPMTDMVTYMGYLERRFRSLGGTIRRHEYKSLDQALQEAPVVVNCTGVGARALASDAGVEAEQGQVVVVTNPGIDTFFIENTPGMTDQTNIFPHRDTVVISAADRHGDWGTAPDRDAIVAIMERCAAVEPALRKARVLAVRVGHRPLRGEVRVEEQEIPTGRLLHAYGHGGAGLTLSVGCAEDITHRVLGAAGDPERGAARDVVRATAARDVVEPVTGSSRRTERVEHGFVRTRVAVSEKYKMGMTVHGGSRARYAVDRESGKRVVIKEPREPTEAAEDSLAEEASAIRDAWHPGVVRLHEYSRRPSFMVMDRVDGAGLGWAMAPGRNPYGIVAAIGQDVAEALGAVHEAGWAHQGVTSGSIMVENSGHAVLGGFGAAARLDPRARSHEDEVVSSRTAAPERISRFGLPPRRGTEAGDLFSVGRVMYGLATGMAPYHVSGGDDLPLRWHRTPGAERAFRPDVPPEFRQLLWELLDLNPANRPKSASVVAERFAEMADRGALARTADLRRTTPLRLPTRDLRPSFRNALFDVASTGLGDAATAMDAGKRAGGLASAPPPPGTGPGRAPGTARELTRERQFPGTP